jgi:hypothetical protein
MDGFESTTKEQFFAAIAEGPSSATFKKVFARLDSLSWFDRGSSESDYQIHRGPLVQLDNFAAPAISTLVIGDLIVNGLVDLHCPDFEE